jgi:hypothetical protein
LVGSANPVLYKLCDHDRIRQGSAISKFSLTLCAGLPSLLGGSANPLLQNLVITKEDLTSLAATLGLPAPGETAALGAAGLDPATILAQSLAETKAEVKNILWNILTYNWRNDVSLSSRHIPTTFVVRFYNLKIFSTFMSS